MSSSKSTAVILTAIIAVSLVAGTATVQANTQQSVEASQTKIHADTLTSETVGPSTNPGATVNPESEVSDSDPQKNETNTSSGPVPRSEATAEPREIEGTQSLPQPSSDNAWPMFQYNRFNIGHHPVISAPAEDLTPSWDFETNDAIASSPAVKNGVVYVGSDDGGVYAVNKNDGDPIWSYEIPGDGRVFSSPAVSGGKVVVGTTSGSIISLDAATGDVEWTHGTDRTVLTSPTVHNGIVFIGSGSSDSDSTAIALDSDTGELEWSTDIPASGAPRAPAVNEESVVMSVWDSFSESGGVFLMDPDTGEITGQNTSSDAGPPVIHNNNIYLNGDGQTFKVDMEDGSIDWSKETGAGFSTPAVKNGIVYVSGDIVYALDADTGTTEWTHQTEVPPSASPSVADGTVYVGTGHYAHDDGTFYALEASTGELIDSFSPGDSVESSAAIVNGGVFVGSHNGRLYGFVNDVSEPQETEISLENISMAPGETATMNVSVESSSEIAGYQTNITFDESAISVDSVTGVQLSNPVVSINNNDGWVSFASSQATAVEDPVVAELTISVSDTATQSTSVEFVPGETQVNNESASIPIDSYESGQITISQCTPGDVNDDGEVNSLDATLTQRYIVGLPIGGEFISDCADMNDDGDITSIDVTLIYQTIVGESQSDTH